MNHRTLKFIFVILIITFIVGVMPLIDLFHNHEIDGQRHADCPVNQLLYTYQTVCSLVLLSFLFLLPVNKRPEDLPITRYHRCFVCFFLRRGPPHLI